MGTVHKMAAAQLDPPPEKWFRREKDGGIVFAGETYEDHVDAWGDAQVQVDAGLWGQAQIAASLSTNYNERTVMRFAHDVHRSAAWIWQLARTYRAFPEKQSRLDYLSFSHHVEAAKAGTSGARVKDPVKALNKAHDKEWSTRELAEYVETGVEPGLKVQKTVKLPPELQKLYDRAVREHLDATIGAVRQQAETPPDPLLGSVYRKVIEIMEWQRDRNLETDCMAIMKIFTAEEGAESPESVSDDYIAAWLNSHGWIMGDAELDSRLELLVKLRMVRMQSREGSRGPTQRGSIPIVYAADDGYAEILDRVSLNPRAPERLLAIRKDWIARLTRHAPELLPKESVAA